MLVIDLTSPLDESTPVYQDARGYSDPLTRVVTWVDIGGASRFKVSLLQIGLHTGTHVDAPAHFVPGGKTIDELPPEALVGTAIVVDLRGEEMIDAERLVLYRARASREEVLPLLLLNPTARLATDAIEELIAWRRPLLCVAGGLDGADPACPATAALLGAGMSLAVDLAPAASEVRDGDLLVVAPLAPRGVEGAPARVLAIRLTT